LTPRQFSAVLDGGPDQGWNRLAEKPRPPQPQESGDVTVALRRRPPKDDAAPVGWRARNALTSCSIRWRRSILRFRVFWNLALSPLSCDIGFSRLQETRTPIGVNFIGFA
jgi:hypothetical protein